MIDQLQQLYDVHTVSTEVDRVPDDVDVLMLVHPQHLPDKTLYAIDQFVLKGGKALVFVDPDSQRPADASEVDSARPACPPTAQLSKLFAALGRRHAAPDGGGRSARRAYVNAGTGERVIPVDYLARLTNKKDNFNTDDLPTAHLSQITMATPGILEPGEGC